MSPLERSLQGPDVARECPDAEDLAPRLSHPSHPHPAPKRRHLLGARPPLRGPRPLPPPQRLTLRYARWDLSSLELIDPHSIEPVATLYPLHKTANADGVRRALEPVSAPTPSPSTPGEMAPLLQRLLAEYAATGLPPAYLPFDPEE